MSDEREMRRFWDERARENAYFFVDDRIDYRHPDVEAFFAAGERDLDVFLDMLGMRIAGDDVVVEIGCGVGRLTRPLSDRAAKVIAQDISSEMIERARSHLADRPNVELVHGDGVTLTGIGDAVATVVFSHVVFQHIPDPQIVLGYVREMGRVLRPGGWAGFQVSDDPTVHRPRASRKHRVLAAIGRAPKGVEEPSWLGSAVDLDELGRIAGEAGMTVERVENRGTQFALVLLRRR